MLDTIAYIPTILAYAFILLLLMILTFIVIYVSHKIYISIYDNLPGLSLHHEEFSKQIADPEDDFESDHTYIKREPLRALQQVRKAKTALRIIVMVEPCLLACVLYSTTNKTHMRSMHKEIDHSSNHAIVHYFDRLSEIPMVCFEQHNSDEKPRDVNDEDIVQNQKNRLKSRRPTELARLSRRSTALPESYVRLRTSHSNLLNVAIRPTRPDE